MRSSFRKIIYIQQKKEKGQECYPEVHLRVAFLDLFFLSDLHLSFEQLLLSTTLDTSANCFLFCRQLISICMRFPLCHRSLICERDNGSQNQKPYSYLEIERPLDCHYLNFQQVFFYVKDCKSLNFLCRIPHEHRQNDLTSIDCLFTNLYTIVTILMGGQLLGSDFQTAVSRQSFSVSQEIRQLFRH